MKNITKSLLIMSGMSLIAEGQTIGSNCYVPKEKNRPEKEFVESNYMEPRLMMGRFVPTYSGEMSERRKRILADIRNTREEMRKMAVRLQTGSSLDIETEDMALMQLMQRMTCTTEKRIRKAIQETAKEYNVPEHLTPVEIATRNKQMLVVDFEIS